MKLFKFKVKIIIFMFILIYFFQWNNEFNKHISINLYSNTIYKLRGMFDLIITYFYLINTLNAKIIWFKIKTINWTANLFNLTAIILLENTISITIKVLKFNM